MFKPLIQILDDSREQNSCYSASSLICSMFVIIINSPLEALPHLIKVFADIIIINNCRVLPGIFPNLGHSGSKLLKFYLYVRSLCWLV